MNKKGFGFFNGALTGEKEYLAGKNAFSGTLDREKMHAQLNKVSQIVHKWWGQITRSDTKNTALKKNVRQVLTDLTNQLQTQQNVLFVPIPSSSGHNALPIAFADCLAEYFREKGVNASRITDIDHYVMSATAQSVKAIPEPLRWGMANKKYVVNQDSFGAFKKKAFLKDGTPKAIYIVDDKMGSGVSIGAFTQALEANGIAVKGAISLSGYDIFGGTKEIQSKLDSLLKANEITDISASEMTKVSLPSELKSFCDFLGRSKDNQSSILREAAQKLRKSAIRNNTLAENEERLEAMKSTPALIRYQLKRRQTQI